MDESYNNSLVCVDINQIVYWGCKPANRKKYVIHDQYSNRLSRAALTGGKRISRVLTEMCLEMRKSGFLTAGLPNQ